MSKPKPAASDSRRAELRAAQIAQAKRQKNQRIAKIVVGAVAAVALIVVAVLVINNFSQAKVAAAPPNANAQQSGIKVHSGAAKQGAPVVALFADYQCPACANFERAYGQQLEKLAKDGDIQLEYRTMTFLDTNLRNDSSTRSANAAACADLAGHYADYHNAIYANQPTGEGSGYTDDQLTGAFAQQAGITGTALEEFNSCYTNKRFSGFVTLVDQEAGRAGITGTPTMTVNGNKLELGNLTQDPNSLRDEIMKAK